MEKNHALPFLAASLLMTLLGGAPWIYAAVAEADPSRVLTEAAGWGAGLVVLLFVGSLIRRGSKLLLLTCVAAAVPAAGLYIARFNLLHDLSSLGIGALLIFFVSLLALFRDADELVGPGLLFVTAMIQLLLAMLPGYVL
ncbi:hypothetical protein AMJ57_04110 [Parcubacteria bacterium SG8_24]|nr:MAG: hypothetical protein AMJ57_04110 [Parcubacteria bacterium SG8_24]